jgi:Xaa-Pro aminopeptidase
MNTNLLNLEKDFDLEFDIPTSEYKERVKKVQKILAERGIDVAYASGTPFIPGDVFYLSGYDAMCPENNTMSIISPTKAYLCTGPEGLEVAREMIRACELINLEELKVQHEDYPYSKFRSLRDIMYEATGGKKIKKVGKLTFDTIGTVHVQNLIEQSIKDEFEIVDATDILYEMRFIKSDNELKLLKIGFKICAEAIKKVVEAIKPGVRELEVAAIADYVHKYMGCSAQAFETIVTSGARINTILGRATDKKIEKGDMVAFYINGRYKWYAAHMGRTVVAGGPSKEQAEFLEHGFKAYEIALENFKYGNPAKYLDGKAREYFKSVGLDRYQNFSFCHGAGIHESNEGKASTRFAEWLIPKNILMMINIGLYGHPKFYGFSLEDGAIINSKGETEVLNYGVPIRVQ